jgi:integrase
MMATHPDYPYVSSYQDRHGTTRWRFRRSGKTVTLPGQPGEENFETAYLGVLQGRDIRKLSVTRHPSAVTPRSFGDAWRKVKRSPEWLAHSDATRAKNTTLAEEFLTMKVVEDLPPTWSEMLVEDLKRRHVKEILARFSDTPHKAKHILVAVRKMIYVALDEEWIEQDPTYRLKYRPAYKGWRAWTDEERALFEKRWPIGTAARTAYALALWLGNRRGDLATIKWSQFDFREKLVRIDTEKTGKQLALPLTPMLAEALAPLDRQSPTVLVTSYGDPFSAKSLTGMMAHWTKLAKMPSGCTLHGLRKTLGKMLAESGASTRQLMEMLGHDDIEHAELYSREAEQTRLARDGMAKVVRMTMRKKTRDG